MQTWRVLESWSHLSENVLQSVVFDVSLYTYVHSGYPRVGTVESMALTDDN